MGHKHNVLTDEIFKNSKYIDFIQKIYNIKDFRKEYKKQYEMMLDLYKTFILINNDFFSDSNLSNADKVEKALKDMEKLLYKNYDESNNSKYSVRDRQAILDKRFRYLYSKIEDWHYYFENVSMKDLNNSTTFKNIKDEIAYEMELLEYSGFDNSVIENIEYKKNNIKYYKNYTKYINKFDDLYSNNKEFKSEYKDNFYTMYGIKLSDNDINKIALLFKLICCANNGLVNVINKYELEDFNVSYCSSYSSIYKIYLETNSIDYVSDEFIDNSSDFFKLYGIVKNKIDNLANCDNKIILERFDLIFFYLTMEETIYSHKIKFNFKSNVIDKLVDDLIDIYKDLKNIRNKEQNTPFEELDFNSIYVKVNSLIERNITIFERVS